MLGTTRYSIPFKNNIMRPTKIVVATRMSTEDFFRNSATGKSIQKFQNYDAKLELFPENTAGLPSVYNKVLDETQGIDTNIIFMHDDIHIIDTNWLERTNDGLSRYPIVGLAGNKNRRPNQPSWFFRNDRFEKDIDENLSGIVAHGKNLDSMGVSYYGKPKQTVKLIDGLFMAIRSAIANENSIRFDQRFDFHFYDMDFCRLAELKNIEIGTWDISLMHESGGGFNSESWRKSKELYFQKWGN